VERYNRVILAMIRCYLEGKQKSWDKHLSILGMAIRSMVNRNTGFTPNFLMLGREVAVPDQLFGLHDILPQSNVPEYLNRLLSGMKYAHDTARSQLREVQRRQKLYYYLKVKQNSYEKGDLVYLIDTSSKVGQPNKLRPVYSGPYVITEVLSPILYRLLGRRRSFVVHHDRLRSCQDITIPMWVQRKRHEILSPGSIIETDITTPPLDDTVGASTDGEGSRTESNEPMNGELDETIPYGDDNAPDESTRSQRKGKSEPKTIILDHEDLGLSKLFDLQPRTRSGRQPRQPGHLDDYLMEY
jgi:hypothetical protein